MNLLVSGSTGDIGAAVKSAALLRNWKVVEVNRADWDSGAVVDIVRAAGKLDAVVFATGFCPVKPVALTSDELLVESFVVNCGYFHRLMRIILENRAYNPAGMRAVAISSISAKEGWPGGASYCAAKGALSALARAMNAELAPKHISVLSLEPRYIKTKMFDALAGRMGVPQSAAEAVDEFAEKVISFVE